MTYKETLFFIGKCLTINHEKHNRLIVENELKSKTIDWDSIVKVSTGHFVFPALYCNFKKAGFLGYLPTELVNYMKHITDLNRERNQEIIKEAKEINELLLANNITPIFLKGSGNLIEGLYDDIAERMVGDIDFIISKNDYLNTIGILKKIGYHKVHNTKYDFPQFKHYPRLKKESNIAAIEIHKELVIEKYANEFNYEIIKKNTKNINKVNVTSFKNQFLISIIAKQINDNGVFFKNINLRNAYDVFLLSKKINTKTIFEDLNLLKSPLNCFLASCYETLNKIKTLEYNKDNTTKSYLDFFHKILSDENLRIKHFKKTEKKVVFKHRIYMTYKMFTNKEHLIWLKNALTDKDWINSKLIEFGLKKPKPNA
jgi:hypothetical protein